MNKQNLSYLVNDLSTFDAPEKVKDLLRIVNEMSKNYEKIRSIDVHTYENSENKFKLYFDICNRINSTYSVYITYDETKGDFFDWLQVFIDKDVRYSYEELLKHFEEKFEEASR